MNQAFSSLASRLQTRLEPHVAMAGCPQYEVYVQTSRDFEEFRLDRSVADALYSVLRVVQDGDD